MSDTNSKKSIFLSFSDGLVWLLRVLLFLFIVFIFVIIYKELKQDNYALQAFQVPKKYNEYGLTGLVVADKLQDEIFNLKLKANSSKIDTNSINVAQQQDLKMDVMGIGVSTQSLAYHVRKLLRIKEKYIKGELIDIDKQLFITIRIPDYKPFTLDKKYKEGTSKMALDTLLGDAAFKILEIMDPYLCAVHLYRQNDIEEAMSLVKRILKDRPDDRKWAYLAWGNIKGKANDEEGRIDMYHRALSEDPNFALVLRNFGWKALQEDSTNKAIEYFEKSLINDPNSFSALNGLARAYLDNGKTQKSEEYYKKNIAVNGDSFFAYGNYSDFLLMEKKDTAACIKMFQDASSKLEYDPNFYIAQAGMHFFNGDEDKAFAKMSDALELDPDNAIALMQLSSYYYDQKAYKTAIDYYKRNITQLKEQGFELGMQANALNRLAMAYYMNGEYGNAEKTIDEAISMYGESGYLWSTKAEIYAFRRDMRGYYKYLKEAYERGFRYKETDKEEEPFVSYIDLKRLAAFEKSYFEKDQEKLKN